MKIRILSFLTLAAVILSALTAGAAKQTPETAAQAAVEKWLTLLDEGNFTGSWSGLASTFKKELKKKTWATTVAELRKPMGKVISRKLVSAEFTKDLPGAPDGEYVILRFETEFENKKPVTETVTALLETDLIWRVAGYTLK